MNKTLLTELQLQAGGAHYPSINPQMQETFAKLIVEECAKELLKWQNEPFPLDATSAARIIKEHFGLK